MTVICLTALICATGGYITASLATIFESVNVIQTLMLTPLTYVGGVFYSISELPRWAHTISLANPVYYMVDAFRYGFLGLSNINIEAKLLIMAGIETASLLCALRLATRGVGHEE